MAAEQKRIADAAKAAADAKAELERQEKFKAFYILSQVFKTASPD